MKTTPIITAAAVFSSLCIFSAMAEETVIADDFEIGSQQRAEGTPLAGTTTPQGNALWESPVESDQGIVFNADGEVTAGSARALSASVSVPLDADILTIEADVLIDGSDWCGVAFGGEQIDRNFFLPGEGARLFLLLRPGGVYSVFFGVGSKANLLAEAKAPGYIPHGFNRLQLVFNAAENTVTANVNDATVLKDRILDEPVFVERAGFRINHPEVEPGLPRIDNFKVVVRKNEGSGQ